MWHQAGDTTLEPASQHLASDRKDWETQGDKRETRPRSQPRRREKRPRSRHHGIWHLTAETGRYRETSRRHRETSGRHDPGAGDRRDWEHRETSEKTTLGHSIWHLTAETGRQGDKRETRPRSQPRRQAEPAASVTASGI